MRKFILYSIISVFALISLYVLTFNLFLNEKLHPKAAAWLEMEQVSIPPGQNSHYLLWGLDAPSGFSMREYGEAMVEYLVKAQNESHGKVPNTGISSVPEAYKDSRRIEPDGMDGFCEPSEGYCLEQYRDELPALLEMENNALLLMRYRKLIRLEHYQSIEEQFLTTPFVHFATLLDAQRLHLASIGVRFVEGKQNEALEELAADLRFSRMLMSEANMLITKLVAVKMTASCLQMYGQMLEPGVAENVFVEIESIKALSRKERDFTRAIVGEYRFSENVLSQLERDMDSMDIEYETELVNRVIPFKKNRLLNLQYDYLSRIVALSQLPPEVFDERAKELAKAYPVDLNLWDYFSDPVSAILYETAWIDYTDYLRRQYALDGLIRLVKLKADIIQASVETEAIAEFIRSGRFSSHDITWMGPVRWDTEANMLHYHVKEDDRMNSLYRLPMRYE